MSLLFILLFIFFFILLLLIGLKIEDHFSYLKILYPDKYRSIGSYMGAGTKIRRIDPSIRLKLFIPIFDDRNFKAEENDWKLKKLGTKLTKRCYQIWIVAVIVTILFIFA